MYINSKNNYLKLYQELMKQQQVLEFEFRPAIRQTAIDKSKFIKISEFDDVIQRLSSSEKQIKYLDTPYNLKTKCKSAALFRAG